MDDKAEQLTQLDPRHISVTRIRNAIIMLFLIGAAAALEFSYIAPRGSFAIPILLLAIFAVLILPVRKYRRWGYDMAGDRLRIVSGFLFFSDTIVPFGRIQHIDVDQGPLQRAYGLATLQVHTAGNYNSTVILPGLAHEDALSMREEIRGHIKRNLP